MYWASDVRVARLRAREGEGLPEYYRLDGSQALPLNGGKARSFEPGDLLAPVTPSKVVAVARNYTDHAKELQSEVPKEPLFFLKPPSSVIGPGDPIKLPGWSLEVHHEAELAVVVGMRMKAIAPEQVREHLLGFTCLNDVTARDVQRAEKQFTRAKGADTFCPIGPWLETELPASGVAITCRVDGEVRQRGHSREMIFGLEQLLSFISQVMTLEPGDVVATGTPAGVGPLWAGQTVEVEIDGIGLLQNPVIQDPAVRP
jgi:2-keto-4-pentenoate hydratase/2-oxohepta-3-ene-1,7-dioic acid hydratase in catechol pathway